jgi:hypothetical protein
MVRRNFKVVGISDDAVTVSGGKQWDGSEPLYRINKDDQSDVSLAQIGDIVSAVGTSDPRVLTEGCLESGKNAAFTRPAPLPPPKPVTWNPNDSGDAVQSRPDGSPFSAGDIDRMLREQDEKIAALVADVKFLKCFSREHCGHCQAILSAKGAFDSK